MQDITADILNHRRQYPKHGANCVCMDAYAREIRTQITDVLGSPWPYDSLLKASAAGSLLHVLRMVTNQL